MSGWIRDSLAALLLGAGLSPAMAEGLPSALGRISYGEGGAPGAAICSGVLVAPDLVLTAAHCVRGAAADPASIRFDAGWAAGKPAGQRRGAEVILAAAEDGAAARKAELADLSGDVALVRLAAPFPAGAATPLPLATPSAWIFTLYAFARDTPDAPAAALTCAPLAVLPGLLGLDCAAVSGNSGAPLLQRDGEGWAVAAIMVAASGTGPVRSWAALPPEALRRQVPGRGG